VAQTREKVKTAVASIKALHKLGQALPKKTNHKDTYDKGTVDAAAKKHNVNSDTVRKARQFADPANGYDQAELKELCELIRTIQDKQDDKWPVFGHTHIIRMQSVPKKDRPDLQRKAIIEAWSCKRLEDEIATRYGSRRDGGRKRRVPQDANGLLTQIEGMCETWERWLKTVEPPENNEPNPNSKTVPNALLTSLSANTRAQVRAAGRAINALHTTVIKDLQRNDSNRVLRLQFRSPTDVEPDIKKPVARTKRR
jgi:hypothetical protein